MVVLLAAVSDVRKRRIPNWVTLGGVACGVVLNAIFYPGLPGLAFALKGLCLAFGVYFILYCLHAMGAGDVKLMAAVGSFTGWRAWLQIFVITAIVGGILALVLIIWRGRFQKTAANIGLILGEMGRGRLPYRKLEEVDVRNPRSMVLPHGAVIALGTILFLAWARITG